MPLWISNYTAYLEGVLKEEKQAESLQKLPHHYMELAQLIFANFRDEFDEPDKIISILKDIENTRTDRIRKGMESIGGQVVEGTKIDAVTVSLYIIFELQYFCQFLELHVF